MRRILLTGSSGYIGTYIGKKLLAQPWVDHVYGLDLKQATMAAKRYTHLQMDVADSLDAVLKNREIDTVVHAAFQLRPTHDRERSIRSNLDATYTLLASAASCRVKQFIYLSSASIYGFQSESSHPFVETDSLPEQSGFSYVNDKLAAERMLKEARLQELIPTITVLRPCFVAGRGSHNPLFEYIKKPFVLLPWSSVPMQLLHIDDLCSAVAMLANCEVNGVYNLAGDGALTVHAMAARLGAFCLRVPQTILHPLNQLAWRTHLPLTPVPTSALSLLERPWLIDSTALKKGTGFHLRFTTEQVFEDLAQEVYGK